MKRTRGRDDALPKNFSMVWGGWFIQEFGGAADKINRDSHGPRPNFSAPQHMVGTKTPFLGSIA